MYKVRIYENCELIEKFVADKIEHSNNKLIFAKYKNNSDIPFIFKEIYKSVYTLIIADVIKPKKIKKNNV